MTTMKSADEAITDAAARIVDAFAPLPPWARIQVALSLSEDKSTTLSACGDALLGRHPVPTLARSLNFEMLIGDCEDVALRLGNAEPWSSIKAALEDVIRQWRGSTPHLPDRP